MNFLHLSLKICSITLDISNVPINLLFILKHLVFLFLINKLFLELDEFLIEFLDAVDTVHEGVDVFGSLPSQFSKLPHACVQIEFNFLNLIQDFGFTKLRVQSFIFFSE